MFEFLKNRACPIGVDMGVDGLRLAQLANNGKGVSLIGGGSENRPVDVEPGSSSWQRWAVEAIRRLTANSRVHGRAVIAAMPANEVFIEHIKAETPSASKNAKKSIWTPSQNGSSALNIDDSKLQDALLSKVKQKLPIELAGAMIKYVPTQEDNVLVMAIEREKINRYLAIYEKANLHIKSIGVWPVALANTYVRFFGRRKADVEAIVMLTCIDANHTNVVICRHSNLLFACSIPTGAKQLQLAVGCGQENSSEPRADDVITRLVFELTACKRHFSSMYRKAQIERLIFFSSCAVDGEIYATIAKQLEMPAQMGDCLAAVRILNPSASGIDRRNCKVNWATAFGLSLSQGTKI